ncbi:sulfatase domain-containingprotein [Purpureocillium lavendulum]|uniref:Sulfatase domain-containingprotein n=1 Tax=Purpureocillium lavendulum TaxID=1247861 RepID=A0AB34G6Q7_9HYPO|nr:sulfatase domain-containingprotein [Purpureocillium lavendulum]
MAGDSTTVRARGGRPFCSIVRLLVLAAVSRFKNRRLLHGLFSRFACRTFVFSVAAVSTLCAKAVHVFAHHAALSTSDLFFWGSSFFAQDTAFLLLLRLALDDKFLASRRWLRFPVVALAVLLAAVTYGLASANVSFFAVAGSEVHWRNIGFVGDASSRKVLLSGLASSIAVGVALIAVSWLVQDYLYALAGLALEIVAWPFARLGGVVRRCLPSGATKYIPLRPRDEEDASDVELKGEFDGDDSASRPSGATWLKVIVGVALIAQVLSLIVRPSESSLIFLSWTMVLLPWVDFAHSSPSLAGLLPYYGNSINRHWDDRTALDQPVPLSWLPSDGPLAGFEDWYNAGSDHYNAAKDPLKISNLDDDLLPGLREALAGISIRHVVLLKLESTRKDVFPIKKNGFIWNRLADTFPDKNLSAEAQTRLETLTRTANFVTGDYDDGFEHKERKRRGGINFNNAYTTATYTLKSMTGTLCGITPLVADFNVEYQNHIYQPCLPHILEAFNKIEHKNTSASAGDFKSSMWRSSMIQSITDTYDKQSEQMPFLGYIPENFVYKEYLQSSSAKFGPVTLPEINYYGMAEVAVEDYLRDAFVMAREKNERLFLSHFTSTTHHPFAIPEEEEYVNLSNDGLNDLSHYVNSVGYVDRWLGRIFEILDEQKVANETLIIMVGDHGISVAENNGVTPYYNPNIGNFHVPLVISHPALPQIDVNDAVESLQILPSILDLLLETGSLSGQQREAARDLIRNYEGQSLIRPLRKASPVSDDPVDGHGYWQFTVMNPGRAMLAVRDAREPNWRLIVPMVENTEWRFTDLTSDPHEEDPTIAFDFFSCLEKIKEKHGIDKSKWAEEAAFMTRWWVEENRKRYRYQSQYIQNN